MKRSRLLWVDDEIELLRPYILFLQEKGYDVDSSVYTVKQAVNEILNLRGEKI